MREYKIITECTAVSEYKVLASSKENARERFSDGEFVSETVIDWRDEDITRVTEPVADEEQGNE